MTLQQLRYLDALSRTNHMGRAAEMMYTSEPALSMALKKLEQELSVELLARSGRSVRLTEAGEALCAHAERILREVRDAEHHMRSFSETQAHVVRVGYVTPLARRFVPEHMRAFLDQPANASARFYVESGSTRDLLRMLLNGVYDFILCSDPGEHPMIESLMLFSQPLMLISSPQAPVTIQHLEQLESLPLIGYPKSGAMDSLLSTLQAEHGFSLNYQFRAPDEASIAAMVERSLGCAIVARVDGLERCDVHSQILEQLPGRGIYCVTRRGQKLTGASGRFYRFLQQSAGQPQA